MAYRVRLLPFPLLRSEGQSRIWEELGQSMILLQQRPPTSEPISPRCRTHACFQLRGKSCHFHSFAQRNAGDRHTISVLSFYLESSGNEMI